MTKTEKAALARVRKFSGHASECFPKSYAVIVDSISSCCGHTELLAADLRTLLALAEKAGELERRIVFAVAHLDRAIDAERRPAAVLQGDAQLARHALTGSSSKPVAPRRGRARR